MSVEARLKVVTAAGENQVLCEIRHPMTNNNYLTQLVLRVNGDTRAEMLLGRYVAANPVIGTTLPDLIPGDRIEAAWRDLGGAQGSASITWSGEQA